MTLQNETTLNQFFIGYLEQLAEDVNSENLISRMADGGHTPLWILGHLAICGELGVKLLGGELTNPQWLVRFGPGSMDEFSSSDLYEKEQFLNCIKSSYPQMIDMANNAEAEVLNAPHGVELLDGTPVKTIGHLISHLLTTHFAFHTAQLSGWRRAIGHAHLF